LNSFATGNTLAVTVSHLRVRHRLRVILDDLNLEFSLGRTALLGPNGAGKTTLIRAIAGLLGRRASAAVTVFDQSAATSMGRSTISRQLGYQSQSGDFLPSYTVQEALAYSSWLKQVSPQRATKRVTELLEIANLTGLRGRKVGRLSGGELKRLSIAQALVHEPSILLLDEPTAALDPSQRRDVLAVLQNLSPQTTLILSTHNLADVAAICEKVVVLNHGRALFHGPLSDFATRDGLSMESAYYRAIDGEPKP